jgi:hypothetical protein
VDPYADLKARTERLLASDKLTGPTREALKARLERRYGAPRLFDSVQIRTLRAVSARLIPAPDIADAVDLAGAFDAALADGDGDGWRHLNLQPDRELHPLGLDALDAAARRRFACGFATLNAEAQDELLQAAADGRLDSGVEGLDTARWFEELLTLLVELHFSHPLVQVAMGYDGMADAHGVQSVSLAQVAKEARHAG